MKLYITVEIEVPERLIKMKGLGEMLVDQVLKKRVGELEIEYADEATPAYETELAHCNIIKITARDTGEGVSENVS